MCVRVRALDGMHVQCHVDSVLADRVCAALRAQENMRVQFRGDALHALDGFQSSLRLPRVSLVVKQYKVPAGDYPFAPEWVQAA